MNNLSRASRMLVAFATALCFAVPAGAAPPPTAPQGSIVGTVVDATDGIPIPNVAVRVIGATLATQSDASGRFKLDGLAPGRYILKLSLNGYQPAVSEPIQVGAATVKATLAMHRGSGQLSTIAVTSSRASDSLQQSSTFTQTLNAEELEQEGVVRAADALRELPGVNNGITGDTAALADDVNLNIRGIGTLETEAALDGHPIGYGIKGGYNYELSPVYGLRDVTVMYGSASDLVGVNAIGGVVNFQTLDPTPDQQATFTQGYGTFEQLSSSFRATGTVDKLGYALAYGVSGLDGPFRNDTFYQPGAAFDQSVLSGPVHDLGVYTDDSSASTVSGLLKLRYSFDPHSSITYTMLSSSRWSNKTGNGDGDYLPYNTAIARGNQQLSSYNPATSKFSVKCAPGTFPGTNALGLLNGYGPNGQPDGGTTCQTPQQYAAFNTGYQGAGPSWQAFHFNDNSLNYQYQGENSVVKTVFYNSYYDNPWDRTFQLPNYGYPGSNESTRDTGVNESGFIASDDLLARNNDFEFGTSYMNDVYFLDENANDDGTLSSTSSDPIIHETAYFLRDVWHPGDSPLAAYANVWEKHSTATNTSYLDSRISLVDRMTAHDIVRGSVGSTTTQPSQDMLNTQYVPNDDIIGAGGGAAISCDGLNSVGTTPTSALMPERGVDEDLAYTHRWQGDTQAQLTIYNTNVYDKLYSTIVPISETGSSFIPPALLAEFTSAVSAKCGAAVAPSLLGVTGNYNVGTMRARGADLNGRYRARRNLYFDYDWSVTSTALLGANTQLLESSLTLIPGSQVARVPLHTANASADYTLWGGLDMRYSLYTVSAGNTKDLPAYDYSNLRFAYPVKNGVITATVLNLFNQWGSIAGLIGDGLPLPLNRYATVSSYTPYIGAAATEQFGLPYRTIYFSYQVLLGKH